MHRVRIRFSLLTLIFALLTACNQATDPTTPGTPPAGAPEALVYGMAANPVFEALKPQVRMTQWDGSQEAADFDLVILDGDGYGAQQLREDELIQEAIRGGVWVLSLNVEEDEKLDGLGYVLGAATPDDSHAYLVRQTRTPNGHPSNDHVDFPNDRADAEWVAKYILDHVQGRLQTQQFAGDEEVSDPHKGQMAVKHNIFISHNVQAPIGNNPGFTQNLPRQTVSWVQSGYVWLFLENDENPLGDRQWLAVEMRGEANPNKLYRSVYNCKVGNCTNDTNNLPGTLEVAWPQTLFSSLHQVPEPFSLVKTSPSNVNEQSEVTTTSGFSIGVTVGGGPTGPTGGVTVGFSYSTSTKRDLTAWKVQNVSVLTGGGAQAAWKFASANPWDGLNIKQSKMTFPIDGVFDKSVFEYYGIAGPVIKEPNALSQGDFAYATSSVWRSDALSTATIAVSGSDSATYTNAYVMSLVDPLNWNIGLYPWVVPGPWTLNLNLGSVVPVSIKSINVGANNTVTAGKTTTGTVTLTAPANADATISLYSDSQFFTIPTETITIPKGSTTGTFQVQTSNDGTCQDFGAQVKAFYTTGLRQEVQIVQPTPARPGCP